MSRKPKQPPTEIAAWVRHVRTSVARLSQEKFAATVGLHEKTITRIETGRYAPAWDSIDKILAAYPSAPSPDSGAMSDPEHRVAPEEVIKGEYSVQTYEGQVVGRELDQIDDPALRRRARNAALQAIEEERNKHPSELGVDQRPDRAQRNR